MNRRRSLVLSLVLGLALLAAVPSVSAQTAKDKVALRLDFWAYGAHAAFAYGIEKGIFAEEGIDLTLLEGNGSGPVVQAVGAGIDRFAWADATTMAKLASKGLPVKMIANQMQVSPLSILFFTEKGLKSPKDLEGKKVAFTLGDSIHQSFPAFLRAANVDKAKIQEVLLDPQAKATALMQGVVDAMGGYYVTFVPILEEQAKKKVSYFTYADVGVSAPANGLIVNTKYLGERSLNCRMVKATARAYEAAAKDVDGAVDALHKLFPKVSGGNKDVTRKVWVSAIPLIQSKNARGKTVGWTAPEDWAQLVTLAKDYGGLAPAKEPTFYYTNEFVDCN